MLIVLAALAAAASASSCRPGAAGDRSSGTATRPDWLQKPSSEDIFWAYPPAAAREELEGRVIISCSVSEQGAPEGCAVSSETPPGRGFGEAALSLTSKMRFKPGSRCGKPVRGTVSVPIEFALVGADAPAAPTGPLDPADPKQALAARLLKTLKVSEALRANVESGVGALIDMVEEERSTSAEERKAIADAARETWAAAETKVMNALVRSYAARLSQQELGEAVRFFESPAGAKLVAVQAGFEADMAAAFEAVGPEVEKEFRSRFCERMQSLCAPPGAV